MSDDINKPPALGDGGCVACRFVGALILNYLLVLDMVGNVVLLGCPPETISARLARLRVYGGPRYAWIGRWACAALTWIGNTFFNANRDHCTWALEGTGTDGVELWRWSK